MPLPREVIHKQPLGTLAEPGTYYLGVPRGDPESVLSCGVQAGRVCVWYRAQPGEPLGMVRIVVCWTGQYAPPRPARLLGTLAHGELVVHVFVEEAPVAPKS